MTFKALLQPDRRFCVAPMMGRTDSHYHWLVRQFCPDILLFTQMLTCRAVIHATDIRDRLLGDGTESGPVVLQLAGSEPGEFATVAPLVASRGYVEINLNIGCPSRRAGAGCFGAVLMRQPERVADLVRATRENTDLPVTVKTRLGVDELDSDDYLAHFLEVVSEAGCRTFYLHARKALLGGLSPAMNRRIPALNYSRVGRMQELFPHLELIINGGICHWQQARQLLDDFAGVMVGRAACTDLSLLIRANAWLCGGTVTLPDPDTLMELLCMRLKGTGAEALIHHLPLLFRSLPNARSIRRRIAESGRNPDGLPALLADLPWHQVCERLAA